MRRRHALLCSTLLATACSGAEARRPAARPAPSAAAAARPALPYESPARWEVHPSPLSYVTAAMRLADGSCLVTEHSGLRWLTWPVHQKNTDTGVDAPEAGGEDVVDVQGGAYSPDLPSGCSGEGRAAADVAPEPLVGIVRWAGSYAFVGESGTIHEALSPLGRFTMRIQPPEPLARVRGAGRSLLAITDGGALLRWDPERGYERADLGGAIAFDLAVSPSGRAVVAAAPEALFTTEDGGRSFARAAAPRIGVQRVGRSGGGPFLIEGVGEALAWDPREPPAFTSTSGRIAEAALDVRISAGRSASASLVTQGRAAIDGDRYWEAGVGETGEWALWKGTLGGRLTAAALNVGGPEDGNVLVAASGSQIALGIVGWGDGVTTVRVRRSRDGGATFGAEAQLVLSELAPLGLAVSRDGAVLVTGACRADDGGEGDACGGGPLLLQGDGPAVAPRAPELRRPAIAPAFSPDGRSAYFLAEGEDDRALSLFVSRDGGASFEERPLRVDLEGDARTFEAANETAITVSEAGTLGMLVQDGGTSNDVWITADADGRGARVAEPPIDGAILGGFGERVLAVPRAPSADEEGARVWESLDGGATWHDQAGPIALRGSYRRDGDVVCGQAGCLVGDDVTRVGWGMDAAAPLPFERPRPARARRGLRAPIVCEPRAGSSWTRVDHVGGADVLPDEGDAARGRAAWTLPTYDPRTGAAGIAGAMAPPSGDGEARIAVKQLLAPAAKGARWAFSHRRQIEGEAFARVRLGAWPEAAPSPWSGRRIKGLEIAWENLEEGTSARAVLPDAGTFAASSIRGRSPGPAALFLDMLSISPKGIFVRATAGEASIFFVDTSGKARSFEFPGWPDAFAEGQNAQSGEPVNVDGTFVMTAMFSGRGSDGPVTLLTARPPPAGSKPDEPWVPLAATIGPPAQPGFSSHTTWTYEGGRLAAAVLHASPDTGTASAWLARIQADGALAPATRLPTPYDLPDAPRGCTPAEHRALPRYVARGVIYGRQTFPGTRHPVLIEDGARPASEEAPEPEGKGRGARSAAAAPAPIGRVAMLSTGLVLRGTPASPCVDAFVARGVAGERVAAVLLGDLRQGWFFRAVAPADAPGAARAAGGDEPERTSVEVRPLTCRFEPSAAVPDSVVLESTER